MAGAFFGADTGAAGTESLLPEPEVPTTAEGAFSCCLSVTGAGGGGGCRARVDEGSDGVLVFLPTIAAAAVATAAGGVFLPMVQPARFFGCERERERLRRGVDAEGGGGTGGCGCAPYRHEGERVKKRSEATHESTSCSRTPETNTVDE